MNNIEKRIEKLESHQEAIHPERRIIFYNHYDGDRFPTDEEIDAATKKFLEEHPDHQGIICLDFLPLDEDITPK